MSAFVSGAVVVTNDDLNAILSSIAPDAEVDDEYDHFLLLDYDQAKALVAKYWDSSWISYGSLSEDFPICYDFSETAEAAIRKGAILEGFKERPAFGVLRYTKNSGDRHAICFVVTEKLQVKYFEPQMADVRWMDAPVDVKSLDNFYI